LTATRGRLMLQTPVNNGTNDTAFCCARQNPVISLPSRRTLEAIRSRDARQETWNSRQVLCRELTLFADRGSERPSSSNRPGDRVDFIPKGIFGTGLAQLSSPHNPLFALKRRGERDRRQPNGRAAPAGEGQGFESPILFHKYLSVWPFRVVGGSTEVTEGYPPYSRLALERVSTDKRVGGEAEGGLFLKFLGRSI